MTIATARDGDRFPSALAIVGASARAAAWSAQRAGFAPAAVDLFADADLRQIAVCQACADYPQGLARGLAQLPPGPWLYTGALENHPDLVDRMAQDRPLWGNGASVLRAVRDPASLFPALAQAGFCCPDWSLDCQNLPRDGSWLRKTLRSGGGDGVSRHLRDESTDDGGRAERSGPDAAFYQAHVSGTPCAAVYVAAAGSARLLGVTQQLIGLPWLGAQGFRYCGSLGPLELSTTLRAEFQRLGNVLADRFGLVGLFGVDAVLAPRDSQDPGDPRDNASLDPTTDLLATAPSARVWPIEVNPRYTASVEVLERALGRRAMAEHVQACTAGQLLPENDRPPRGAPKCCGKAIVYAKRDAVFPAALTERLLAENAALADRPNASDGWPRWADIPSPGCALRRGWPVLTALAACDTAVETLAELRRAAAWAESAAAASLATEGTEFTERDV